MRYSGITMQLVIQSLIKAIGQLTDRNILIVLAKSLGLTLLILAVLGGGVGFGIYWVLDKLGMMEAIGAEAGGIAITVIMLFAGWFLFRIVALAVLQFFADDVVAAVEGMHYREHGQALPFAQDAKNSLKGMGRTILFNLLAMPVAFFLLFTAIGPGIVFVLVNAVLLGRELTDMCWLRLCSAPQADIMPHTDIAHGNTPVSGFERVMLGAAVTGIMLIPLVNLLGPIIGAAAGTHLVHAKRLSG
jgi:uncharacterized protein involved in cysteine biosynthesis